MAREESGERTLTFTEQARRAQLIEVTIALVAEHGYGGTALSRIADGADITKAAVLYHFPSKDAVVQAAYQHVLTALTTDVARAVEQADADRGPAAYIRSMTGHLRQHPEHTRMLVEAMMHQGPDANSSQRWQALAEIMDRARRARGLPPGADLRTLAIMIGGAIDGIVAERLTDRAYDTAEAAEELVQMLERTLFA